MFDFGTHIKIAADDVTKLRHGDVYRLIEECPNEHRDALVAWIIEQRPDYANEAEECLLEVRE